MPELGGSLDRRLRTMNVDVPVKWEMNTRNEMRLLQRYRHGDLKYENTGKTCNDCVNFYPDKGGSRTGGRCRAKGFSEVHSEWPADERMGYLDPNSGMWFDEWPECPLYHSKEELSPR